MDVAKYLFEKGYTYRQTTNSSGRQAIMNCPECGNKYSFAINLDNGAFNCKRNNKCNFNGSWFDFMNYHNDNYKPLNYDKNLIVHKKNYKIPEVHSDPRNKELFDYFKNRGISEETVKTYRIGRKDNRIMIPFYKDNKLIFVEYRGIKEKTFSKEKGCQPILFGQDLIDTSYLIITEGNIDAMSLYEYNLKGVSVPNGVSDLNWIEHDWDFLEKFDTIYLCFDNDHAGQSAVDKIVDRLGRWRCKNVILPYKDMNECLKNKVSKDEIDEYIFDKSIDFCIDEIKTSAQYSDEIIDRINNPEKLYGKKTGLDKMNDILKGWRKNEITLWTGRNGSGKSTFLNQEVCHLIGQGERCLIGSFEMSPVNYLTWLYKQHYRKEHLTNNDVIKAGEYFDDRLLILNIKGEITKDNLFNIMEFAAKKYGCEYYVIDSLMKINLNVSENNLNLEQKKVVSDFCDFAEKFNCHIHLVTHAKKPQGIKETMPMKSDISGSSDIVNLAHNVLSVYRFTDEEREENVKSGQENYSTWIQVLKNREHGTEGGFGLFFDPKTKRFTENNPIFEQKNNMDYIHN